MHSQGEGDPSALSSHWGWAPQFSVTTSELATVTLTVLPSKATVTGVGRGFLVRTQLYPQQSLSLSWYSFSGKIHNHKHGERSTHSEDLVSCYLSHADLKKIAL